MSDDDIITEPGWYWYDTEYTDEGSAGPFDSENAAIADALACGMDREFIGTWEKLLAALEARCRELLK